MNYSESSDRQTAGKAVCTMPCSLTSVILEGDGTNAANVVIYDNASAASGTVLAKVLLKASSGVYEVFIPATPICANNGIYVDVTGTGAAYIVHFVRS